MHLFATTTAEQILEHGREAAYGAKGSKPRADMPGTTRSKGSA
jgi:hypothetical protein